MMLMCIVRNNQQRQRGNTKTTMPPITITLNTTTTKLICKSLRASMQRTTKVELYKLMKDKLTDADDSESREEGSELGELLLASLLIEES
mmetsp:Transcript_20841/g.45135  ORF Transcript_20841/g.45135 Transcript_20841/m.45135 type:complete len:90 (-) Transcript_20841:96-365(-)